MENTTDLRCKIIQLEAVIECLKEMHKMEYMENIRLKQLLEERQK